MTCKMVLVQALKRYVRVPHLRLYFLFNMFLRTGTGLIVLLVIKFM